MNDNEVPEGQANELDGGFHSNDLLGNVAEVIALEALAVTVTLYVVPLVSNEPTTSLHEDNVGEATHESGNGIGVPELVIERE